MLHAFCVILSDLVICHLFKAKKAQNPLPLEKQFLFRACCGLDLIGLGIRTNSIYSK